MSDQERTSTRLSALELQGYKTFATKTEFEFAPTITAVVGPNGSGKSNIADAIRWVLGEQAYSLLRGKKTEDMIFSGSEARPRAGMASATITFDNSGGWLPIDFNEVTVGRRAYRDGQNEYLINGQKVRLRDVSELLAESGLAERTYTVIGQGLVDAALALRAEERRELFEEAAGIGLYRSRREEAVRRLDSTRRNLERVQDILAELRPRLRSLERQAQRARDYRQVKEDLRSSLRLLYGYHWDRMQGIVSEARRVAQEHGRERQRLLEQQREIDDELKATRERIANLREQLQSWSGEASSLFERREQLGRQRAVLKERIRWLGDQQEMMRGEVDSLESEAAALTKAVTVAEEELEERQREVRRHEGEAVTDEEEGGTLRDRRELQEEIDQLRRNLEQLAAREAAWTTEAGQLKDRRSRLEERMRETRALRAEAEETVDRLQTQLDEARAARDRVAERLAAVETELEAAREDLIELEAALVENGERRSEAAAEAARLQSRLEALREMAEGSQSGARSLLSAAEHGQLQGVVGRVVRELRVNPRHRLAVQAALGEVLGGLAFDGSENLEAALNYLANRETRGRTVLLPLDAPLDSPPVEPPDLRGVVGGAAESVEGDSPVASSVKNLLARTWIVEDRKAARRLRSRGEAEGVQLVTRAGELFRPDGAVVVGAPYLGPGKQERETLDRQRTAAEGRVQALAEKAQELEERIAETKGDILRLEERKAAYQEELEGARARLQSLELERREASARLEGVEGRRVTFEAEYEEVRERQRALSAEGEAFEEERGRMERRLASLRRRLEAGDREEADALEAEWQAARQSVAEADDRLKERRSRLQRVHEELEEWRQRLLEVEAETEEKEEELAEVEAEAERVEATIQGRQGEISPAEEELRQAEAKRTELEGEEGRIRFELQAAENRHSQAQVELARREEEMHGLQRRIEDDFGLVAYEYDKETTGQEPLPLEGLVEKLPAVEELPEGLEGQVKRQRAQLRRMGSINPEAQQEYEHVKERVGFLTTQVDDLREAENQIQEVIAELDVIMAREFRKTFDAVATAFRETFERLFDGGSARLTLSDPEEPNESGIEIEARLPGKREQGLAVLSGGERSLTASALIFALLKVSPTPFCVLDEVDAMLDEANLGRFLELLRELSKQTQFIVITHNRLTVQAAQSVYGVSMSADSTSQVISLNLDEAAREVAA